MLQPPGIDNLQYPNLDNIGPISKKEALIFLIRSLFTFVGTIFSVFIFISLLTFDISTLQFNSLNKLQITKTSSSIGVFSIIILSGHKIVPTIIGSTEFLAALIFTSPFNLLPLFTIIFSILSSKMNS